MSVSAFIEPDVASWVRARLVGDTDLLALLPGGANSVFASDPMQGAERPYMVIQLQGTQGVLRTNGPYVFWEDFLYLVKVVGTPQQFGQLKAIMKRAHQRLELQNHQNHNDAHIVICEYERAFNPPADNFSGTLTKQLGGFYRTKGQALIDG